ncbi:hypothetical protein HY992_06355 [Candidatus Micrarchaeota archaeon]|nr:hypothetical protein [Candidatus Micrarchaeota archaeon]
MEKRVYECLSSLKGKLDELLKSDPYVGRSFSKQGYTLKEGKSVGAEADKYYVLINADDEFFKWAEEKFKAVENVKRTGKETEAKIIAVIDEEASAAEGGLGAIFG